MDTRMMVEDKEHMGRPALEPTCGNCGRSASLNEAELCAPCAQDKQYEAMALAQRNRR